MIWSYKQVILYFGLINRHLWVILQIIRQLEKSLVYLSLKYRYYHFFTMLSINILAYQ
jgi:hypothetical protein